MTPHRWLSNVKHTLYSFRFFIAGAPDFFKWLSSGFEIFFSFTTR